MSAEPEVSDAGEGEADVDAAKLSRSTGLNILTQTILVNFVQSQEDELSRLVVDDDGTFHLSMVELESHSPSTCEHVVTDDAFRSRVLNCVATLLEEPALVEYVAEEAAEHEDEWEEELGVVLTPDSSLPVTLPDSEYDVRLCDPTDEMHIQIGHSNLDRVGELVAIDGICQQASPPSPRMSRMAFRCEACVAEHHVDALWTMSTGDVDDPGVCDHCEHGNFAEAHDRHEYVDYQQLKIQESPDGAEDPSNPRDIMVDVIDDVNLLDEAKPGDRVTILGELSIPKDSESTVVRPFIDARAIATDNERFEVISLSEDDIKEIEKLAELDDDVLFDILMDAIAPDIIGRDSEKLAIVLQLFGGTCYVQNGSRERGEVNVLFIGDPGTGKTDLLEAAANIAPLVVETSGEGATGVGLTASVNREEIAGQSEWVAKAGPVVLADRGMVTVDEFDKISDEDKPKLNSALEKGYVKLNKASINTELNSRVSALVAANPVNGRFDRAEPYVEQFNLSADLFDRFDIVFAFEDDPDEDIDREVVRNKLKRFTRVSDDGGEEEELDISHDLLRKYVAYSRRNIEPMFEEDSEALGLLEEFFIKLRKDLSNEASDTVAVNYRDFNTFRRLAQASARARLSDTIEEEDAYRVIQLVMKSLGSVFVDVETGQFDANKFRKEVCNR